MRRKGLLGILIVGIVLTLILAALIIAWTKNEVNGWLWNKPEGDNLPIKYLPPCDTLIIQEEFRLRRLTLENDDGNWVCDEDDEFDINYLVDSDKNEKNNFKGLRIRYSTSGSGAGNIWEREVYASGKKLLVVNSDVPEGSVDTVCECVEIAFSYCDREVKYTLETGEENYKHWDQVDHKHLSRAEADSVLLTWGIRRELPPEDHPWLYREEQLRKAEESQR